MVKEKPIIFSTDMVKAILDGRKTQTRRAIKFPMDGVNVHRYDGQDENGLHLFAWGLIQPGAFFDGCFEVKSPYKPGDVLWVRETWQHVYQMDDFDKCIEGTGEYYYAADGEPGFTYWVDPHTGEHKERMPWRPSIYMPREAARLFLRVTDVRVEQVQDISEEDALAEGVRPDPPIKMVDGKYGSEWSARDNFIELWDSLNAKRGFGWDANPWVWVYTFERIEQSELHEDTP